MADVEGCLTVVLVPLVEDGLAGAGVFDRDEDGTTLRVFEEDGSLRVDAERRGGRPGTKDPGIGRAGEAIGAGTWYG